MVERDGDFFEKKTERTRKWSGFTQKVERIGRGIIKDLIYGFKL